MIPLTNQKLFDIFAAKAEKKPVGGDALVVDNETVQHLELAKKDVSARYPPQLLFLFIFILVSRFSLWTGLLVRSYFLCLFATKIVRIPSIDARIYSSFKSLYSSCVSSSTYVLINLMKWNFLTEAVFLIFQSLMSLKRKCNYNWQSFQL